MFIYGDTSPNLLGIAIYIKVTISAWTIIYRFVFLYSDVCISTLSHAGEEMDLDPEAAARKAAEKETARIMKKAKKKAKLMAKLAAEKEVKKILNTAALAFGSKHNKSTRYIEDVNATVLVDKILSSGKRITLKSWAATGKLCSTFLLKV